MSSKGKIPFNEAAAAALDALHAALTHEVHCQYFLKGKHELHMGNLMKASARCPAQLTDSDLSMYAVIDNMEGRLPAQLTAAACVMRLFLSEIEQREEVGKQNSTGDVGPYCLRALNNGWFGGIIGVMCLAIQVILRALLGMAHLCSSSLCHVFWLGCARQLRQCCTIVLPENSC